MSFCSKFKFWLHFRKKYRTPLSKGLANTLISHQLIPDTGQHQDRSVSLAGTTELRHWEHR